VEKVGYYSMRHRVRAPTLGDFDFKSRRDFRDAGDETDGGEKNLFDLWAEFLGYLRR